ncbi:MAG: plasmid pRiA4b ORF-3 family protein [Candidatus Cryptobacteroides sp.]
MKTKQPMYYFDSNEILASLVTPLYDENKSPKKYTVEITLDEAPVKVMRRLDIPSNLFIGHFINLMVIAMGWERYHLTELTQGNVIWRSTKEKQIDKQHNIEYNEFKVKNSFRTTVSQLFKKVGEECKLLYDMGDSWNHTIRLIETGKYSATSIAFGDYGVDIIGGEGYCPLEDCGGIEGYKEILRIMRDPEDPEYEYFSAILGKSFDPSFVDSRPIINRINDYQRVIHEVGERYFER